MKIRRVGAELFHASGRTDRHDEDNNRFAQFCKRLKSVSRSVRKPNLVSWYVRKILIELVRIRTKYVILIQYVAKTIQYLRSGAQNTDAS